MIATSGSKALVEGGNAIVIVQTKVPVGNYGHPGVPAGIRYGVSEVGANGAGSTAVTMTPPLSRWRRWPDGGNGWVSPATLTPPG